MSDQGITFNLTRRDLIGFMIRSLLPARLVGMIFLAIFMLEVVYIVYSRGMPDSAWSWFALFIAGAGGSLGTILVFSLAVLIIPLLTAGKAPGVLGMHQYVFVQDGLLEKTAVNETLIKWNSAHAVTCTKSSLYIEMSPRVAHVLPRRAFPDERRYAEFFARASRLVVPGWMD